MNHLTEQIDLLFEDIMVVTPDSGWGMAVMTHQYVAISKGEIKVVSTDRETACSVLAEGFQTYAGKNRVLMSAFANAHGHLPMTLMRNTADDLPLHDWLFNNIFPRESKLTEKEVYAGANLALLEMIRGGTACAADMYYYSEAVARAALEAGFRLNLCCEGKGEDSAGESVLKTDQAKAFVEQYDGAGDGLLKASLLVHSIYLYEESMYRKLADLAKQLGIGIQVHVSETKKEVEDCLRAYGMRPPEKLAEEGVFEVPTVAAHCVWLDRQDREILKRHNVTCVHNPVSNLKLGSGIADVQSMLESGLKVALGTDGAASNNRLDMFQEMRLASLLPKGVFLDPVKMTAPNVLRMATTNGYEGLGFSQAGRVAPGTRADLQVINLTDANIQPAIYEDTPESVLSALVYSAGPENVESVYCDGRCLLYKNSFLTIDEEKVIAEALQAARRLR